MREHKSPGQRLRAEGGVRTGQPPQSPGPAKGGRCGRWVRLARQRHGGSPARWESALTQSVVKSLIAIARTYLVVGDVVVGAHALDLSRRQHPADIVDDVQIGRC